jgi:hypothetical protein
MARSIRETIEGTSNDDTRQTSRPEAEEQQAQGSVASSFQSTDTVRRRSDDNDVVYGKVTRSWLMLKLQGRKVAVGDQVIRGM